MTKAACDAAYTADGYSQSVTNLTQVSLSSDNVFGNDGGVLQLATITGSVAAGTRSRLLRGSRHKSGETRRRQPPNGARPTAQIPPAPTFEAAQTSTKP
jgi:hypothetical protein